MNNKKFVVTLLIVLCALGAVSGQVDSLSKNYIENALKNALVTIVIARSLNGVISVAQGTEVALEPGGIGVSFSVGEILDPINDMVERFSSVMLFAASSLGLQALRVDERLSQLQAQASNASEHIISLIAIFVLQTIILPLLFLWLFGKFLKALVFRSRYFKE